MAKEIDKCLDFIEQLENRTSELKDEMEKRNEEISKLQQQITFLENRLEKLEGLDVSKYLKDGDEIEEKVDERIANLLELAHSLNDLNKHQREATLDYLSKKSKVNKTELKKVVEAFETYLEKLI